jgi:hypothetical protein
MTTNIHDLLTTPTPKSIDLRRHDNLTPHPTRTTPSTPTPMHRRLRALHRAHVIRPGPMHTTSRFERPTYVLDLTGTGISVTQSEHPST